MTATGREDQSSSPGTLDDRGVGTVLTRVQRATTLVNHLENLRCVSGLGESSKNTRAGIHRSCADRENLNSANDRWLTMSKKARRVVEAGSFRIGTHGDTDDDIDEVVEAVQPSSLSDDYERRGSWRIGQTSLSTCASIVNDFRDSPAPSPPPSSRGSL